MSFVELCWGLQDWTNQQRNADTTESLQVQNTVDDIRHHLGKLRCEGTQKNPDKWIMKVSTVTENEIEVAPERTGIQVIG
jgi:hypothetical protein